MVIFAFLKSTALMLLGASTVFGCSVANALTFTWNIAGSYSQYDFDSEQYNDTNPFLGSGTFTTLDTPNVGANGYTLQSVTGSIDGNSVTLNRGTLYYSSGYQSVYVNGDGIYLDYDGGTYNIASFGQANVPAQTLYDSGTNQQSFNPFTTNQLTNTSVAAVPAPLPILGLPAVLFYSRKLKKRIKARREISSNALV